MKKILFALLFITMAFSQFDNTVAGWYRYDWYVPNGNVYVGDGKLVIKETITPTPLINYGQIYTKTDNQVYFQDGAGVEHTFTLGGNSSAEMYFNANAVATVIETTNTPIALRNFTTGALENWTYSVGSTGAITAFADYGVAAGDTVTVSSAVHGLVTGDIISIRGTTNYNGIWEVGYIGAGSFYIVDTWVADDGASDWDEGDYLLAGTGAAGKYEAPWGLSASEGGAAGSTVLYCLYVNTTQQDKTRMPRKFANNDVGSFSCPAKLTTTIAEGDRVFMTANSTGTNAITNGYGAIVLKKL